MSVRSLFKIHRLLTGCAVIWLSTWSAASHAIEAFALGDSITQGLQRTANRTIYGITSPLNGAANIGAYLPGLKSKLDANIETSNLYNWGVGGEVSTGGVGRIGNVLNTRPADYILILYGANDLYAGISSSTTRANVGSMIDQSKARDVVPIVSEITPNIYDAGGVFDNLIANVYNPDLKNIAAQKDVEIVLMFFEMRAGWESLYNSGDGLHLSNAGYEKMSQEWFEVLELVHLRNSNSNIVPLLIPLLFDEATNE